MNVEFIEGNINPVPGSCLLFISDVAMFIQDHDDYILIHELYSIGVCVVEHWRKKLKYI